MNYIKEYLISRYLNNKSINYKMPGHFYGNNDYQNVHKHSQDECEEPVYVQNPSTILKIQAECPEERIRYCLPLCMPWTISFDFVETSNITPSSFTSTGLFNVENCCLQSVSTVFFSPDRAPTTGDLDQSTITLPIPGCVGSITGEVYLFGDRSEYTASLKPYLLKNGRTVTLLTNFIKGANANSETSIQLVMVARLFYCAIKDKKKHRIKCRK